MKAQTSAQHIATAREALAAGMARKYYRPTPGVHVGTWNLFTIGADPQLDVPFADLPAEVQQMIRDRLSF